MTDKIDWTDETLRTLDELARIAFPVKSGVTADSLKRLVRSDKLVVYRPGKPYLSTLVNIRVMLDATRVRRQPMPPPLQPYKHPDPLGRTDMEVVRARLDHVLEELRRPQREEALARKTEHARTTAARKRETQLRRNNRAREAYCKKKEAPK